MATTTVLALLAAFLPLIVLAPPASAALTDFTVAYHSQQNGRVLVAGNSLLTCPTSATGCATARTGGGSNRNNNDWNMVKVDADSVSGTSSSSSSNISWPAGSEVLWAGLYWGARTVAGTSGSASSGALNQIKFRVPNVASYQTVTGTLIGQAATSGTHDGAYQSGAVVTDLVKAAGVGTYWGADVAAATGQDRMAGWALFVVLRNPGDPLRDLTVFQGFQLVSQTADDLSFTVSGFKAPTSGPVNARIGLLTYEGDLDYTGDSASLNGNVLSDPVSPSDNFFNSAWNNQGTYFTDRTPADQNMFGLDIDNFAAGAGLIPNSATSATFRMTTNSDFYYPGVVTTAIDIHAPGFEEVVKSVTNRQGHSPAQVGDTLDYTVSYTNVGLDAATNAVLRDPLPANTTFLPGSLSVLTGANQGTKTDARDGDQAEYDAAGRQVVFRLGTGANGTSGGRLNPNDKTSVRFSVTVGSAAAGTTLSNTPLLDYHALDLNKDFTHTGNTVQTPVGEQADVALTKTSSPTTLRPGQDVTWTVVATNRGPNPATGVTVTDTIPAGTTFKSATSTVGTCSQAAGTVTCPVGNLAANASATITIVATVGAGVVAPITNTATVASTSTDPDLTNNTASATTQVTPSADVSITKTAAPSPVHRGSNLTFTLTAQNAGPSAAANVVVTDVLPPGTTFVSADAPCTHASGTVTCALGQMASGASRVLHVTVTVGVDFVGTPLHNTASIVTTTDDPNPANNTASSDTPVDNSADVRVTKTGAATVVAGQSTSYTVTVTNDGPSNAANVVLTDTLPAGVTVIPPTTSSQGTCAAPVGGTLTCTLGTITSGASAVISITVLVAPSATGSLVNSATATSSTPDPNTGNNTGTATGTVTRSADLAVTKVGTPNPVSAGQNVTYTITVTNNGPSTAVNTTISDPLPAAFTFGSANSTAGTCTGATGGRLECQLGTLTVGATVTVTVVMGVPDGFTPVPVTNTATVASNTPDPNSANNQATFILGTGSQANLGLTKTAPDTPVVAGSDVTYTITVTNQGPSAAVAVTVTDQLPTQLVFKSGPGCSAVGQAVTCSVGAMGNGATRVIPLVVTVLATAPAGTVQNTARVSSPTPDPTDSNNSDTETISVVRAADLAIVKDASPASVTAGGTVVYTLTVTNSGPNEAASVTVSDPIPAGVTVTSVEPAAQCTATEGSVNCAFPTLAVGGAPITITVRGTVDPSAPASPLLNTATVASATPDPVATNNTDNASVAVTTSADISVSKVAEPPTFVVGTSAAYRIVVRNDGLSDAQGVTLNDPMPAGIIATDAAPGAGTCTVTASPAPSAVACDLGTLASGASVEILISVDVAGSATGPVSNTATVDSDTTDPDPTDNTVTVTTPVTPRADVQIVKTATPTEAQAGELVSYTLQVTNAGPSTAQAVTVTDPLSPNVSLVSVDIDAEDGTCSPTAPVSCSLGDMLVGDSATIVVQVRINANLQPSTVSNTATVASTTVDPVPANNASTAAVVVTVAADLAITKTATSSSIAGENLDYVLTVNNKGPSNAADATVTDTLPPRSTYVTSRISTTGGECSRAGNQITCQLGPLDAGATATVQLTVALAENTPPGPLSNTAAVTSTTPDPVGANNSATVEVIVQTNADLNLTKTAAPATVTPGGTITYTFRVDNAGPSRALAVTVTDVLPTGTTFESGSAGCALVPNPEPPEGPIPPTVVCALGDIPAGTFKEASITVRVSPSVTEAIPNVATAGASTQDPDDSNNTDDTLTPVAPGADVSVVKTGPAGPVHRGDLVTYTLTAHNEGPSDAAGVVVTDAIPAGSTFDSAPGCTFGGGTVTCPVGTLAAGADRVFLVTVRIAADDPNATATDTATVISTTPDPDPIDNTSTVETPLDSSADLEVSKSGPATVVPGGGPATYRIDVVNHGPSAAANVVVTDTIPAGLTVVSVTPSVGTCDSPAAGAVVCQLGTLASGQPAFVTVTVTAPSGLTGSLTDTASATSEATDPVPGNNTDSVTSDLVPSADLGVTKVGTPNPVSAGDPVTYTIVVTNHGLSDAVAATLSDPLPTEFTFTTVSTDAGTCTVTAGVLGCDFGTIIAGGIVTVTLVVGVPDDFVPDADGVTNTATVGSSTADPVPGNNQATFVIGVDTQADVQITKTGPTAPVAAGETAAFTITVTNQGPSAAENVTVTDVLPPQLEWVSGCNAPVPPDDRTVTCNLGRIRPGQIVTRTITVRILASTPAGLVANTATVTSTTDDPTDSNNTATDTVEVTNSANLGIVKTAEPATVTAGGTVTYTLTVTNDGPSDATSLVTVTDSLPTGVTVTDVTPASCQTAGATVTCGVASLAVGASFVVTITATVGAEVADGTTLTNTATVISGTPDPDPGDNTSEVPVEVDTSSDIEVTKVANENSFVAGSTGSYVVRVVNVGPSDAQSVSVTDTMPAGVTATTAVPSAGSCTVAPQPSSVTCDLGTIRAVAPPVTITIGVAIAANATGSVANSATATSPTTDPDPDDNTDTVVTPIDSRADLSIVKTSEPEGRFAAGGQAEYTLTVHNAGPSDAQDVTVTDQIPAGVTFTEATASQGECRTETDGTVTCELGTVAVGKTATVTLSVLVDGDTLQVVNAASVASATTDDPDLTNNSDEVSNQVVPGANLTVTKTSDVSTVPIGGTVTYTVTVHNEGPSTARAVVVSELLPEGLAFVSATPTTGGYDPASGDWTVGDLASGASATLTLVATAVSSGRFTNTASATSDTPDPDPADNTESATVEVGKAADLSVSKTADQSSCTVDGTVVFTVTVSNAGPDEATNVVVTDALPSQFRFAQADASQGTFDTATGVWTVGTLSAGQSAVLTVTATCASAGSAANTATATSDQADPDPDNNTGSVTIEVAAKPAPGLSGTGFNDGILAWLAWILILSGAVTIAWVRRQLR